MKQKTLDKANSISSAIYMAEKHSDLIKEFFAKRELKTLAQQAWSLESESIELLIGGVEVSFNRKRFLRLLKKEDDTLEKTITKLKKEFDAL